MGATGEEEDVGYRKNCQREMKSAEIERKSEAGIRQRRAKRSNLMC